MANLDLSGYLKRIGYGGPSEPTLATLHSLHQLHTSTIAFENLDILAGKPIHLDMDHLFAKLVHSNRGGYCFEQNTLFQAVLREFGFSVESLAARVRWRYPANVTTPRSHMVLLIHLDEGDYLADVGFGSHTLCAPLRVAFDTPQETPNAFYRLTHVDDDIRLDAATKEGWEPVYQISMLRQTPVDWEVANWYTSTHPASRFTKDLMVARQEGSLRYGLLNTALSIHHKNGTAEHQKISSLKAFRSVLSENFAIELPEGSDAIIEKLLAT